MSADGVKGTVLSNSTPGAQVKDEIVQLKVQQRPDV